MTIALVLVGDELLGGSRRDRNGPWLAARCRELGVRVGEMHLVGDDPGRLAALLSGAARRNTSVCVSGGLGPTSDDVTRAALAEAMGVALVEDEAAWAQIRACLRRRGRVPAAGERRQALVPAGAQVLANEAGVAPGVRARLAGATVYALPGVPHELEAMFTAHVAPELVADADAGVARAVWIVGVPESDVAEQIEPLVRGVEVASYPHLGELEIVLRASGERADERVRRAEQAVRERLGARVYDPAPGERIEHVVVRLLAERGLHLATAESFTGGLVAAMLTRVPGASAVFTGGWVTYATEEKSARLGVPAETIAAHGVVSEAVAGAMAEGARQRGGTELGLATTGAAGPDGVEVPGRAPVPPGRVCLALARAGGSTEARTLYLPHGRRLVQRFGAVRALDMVRRALGRGAG
jgi:nicotinamide-nucleotide amidase